MGKVVNEIETLFGFSEESIIKVRIPLFSVNVMFLILTNNRVPVNLDYVVPVT